MTDLLLQDKSEDETSAIAYEHRSRFEAATHDKSQIQNAGWEVARELEERAAYGGTSNEGENANV